MSLSLIRLATALTMVASSFPALVACQRTGLAPSNIAQTGGMNRINVVKVASERSQYRLGVLMQDVVETSVPTAPGVLFPELKVTAVELGKPATRLYHPTFERMVSLESGDYLVSLTQVPYDRRLPLAGVEMQTPTVVDWQGTLNFFAADPNTKQLLVKIRDVKGGVSTLTQVLTPELPPFNPALDLRQGNPLLGRCYHFVVGIQSMVLENGRTTGRFDEVCHDGLTASQCTSLGGNATFQRQLKCAL